MLKPSDKDSQIETHHPIDMVLYDSELSQEANALKQSVVTAEAECKLQRIGELQEGYLYEQVTYPTISGHLTSSG